jgi:hypothetical protein
MRAQACDTATGHGVTGRPRPAGTCDIGPGNDAGWPGRLRAGATGIAAART